jgi:hypothetical protein
MCCVRVVGRQDMICCWEAGRLAVGGIREGGGAVRAELRVYEDWAFSVG